MSCLHATAMFANGNLERVAVSFSLDIRINAGNSKWFFVLKMGLEYRKHLLST